MCTHRNADRVGGHTGRIVNTCRSRSRLHFNEDDAITWICRPCICNYEASVNLAQIEWSLLHLHHPLGEVEMPQTSPPCPACKQCISTCRPEKLIWSFHYSVLLLLYEFGLVGSHTRLAMWSHVNTSALQLHLFVSFYFVPTSSYSLSTRSLIPASRVRCMQKWHPRTPSITGRFVPPSSPYRCRGDTQEVLSSRPFF